MKANIQSLYIYSPTLRATSPFVCIIIVYPKQGFACSFILYVFVYISVLLLSLQFVWRPYNTCIHRLLVLVRLYNNGI
jgi:hypothetical protein